MTTTKVLTRNEMRELAPSIFAEKPHKSRGVNYGYVPTIDVINKLLKADYLPVKAGQSKVKDKGRTAFCKHLINFRHRRDIEKEVVKDGLVPEIILINSHDGSSSFILEAGLFRFVCANGLIIRDQSMGAIRIQHSGKIAERVVEGAQHITTNVPKIIRVTKEWDKIKLSQGQRIAMAKAAMEIRFHGNTALTPTDVLTTRRNEDEAPTLWRTFNVLQENLLNGGQQFNRNGRVRTTRNVKSINNALTYNQKLWELAEAVAKRAA